MTLKRPSQTGQNSASASKTASQREPLADRLSAIRHAYQDKPLMTYRSKCAEGWDNFADETALRFRVAGVYAAMESYVQDKVFIDETAEAAMPKTVAFAMGEEDAEAAARPDAVRPPGLSESSACPGRC